MKIIDDQYFCYNKVNEIKPIKNITYSLYKVKIFASSGDTNRKEFQQYFLQWNNQHEIVTKLISTDITKNFKNPKQYVNHCFQTAVFYFNMVHFTVNNK